MPKATVIFRKLIQDTQIIGGDDEHMCSREFFDLKIGDTTHRGLSVDLKQVVGSRIDVDNIEVGPPQGYDGPFSHHEFHKCATGYFLSWVGPNGHGIRLDTVGPVTMARNEFNGDATCEFEIPD